MPIVESRCKTPVAMKRPVGAASSENPKMNGDATKKAATSTSNTTCSRTGTIPDNDGPVSAVAARRISAMPPTIPMATAIPLSKPKMNGEAMKKPPIRYSRSPCRVAEIGPWRTSTSELIASPLLSSFAESYDRYRPRPPQALLELLMRLAEAERPALVVDVGTGTGLSARAWAGRADRIVGIEPDEAMRAVAEARGGEVEYIAASSDATGLPDACADIVTCSQSLHWMEPERTFAEVARILRRGGIFAAYDYDAIPVVHPEVDATYAAVMQAAQELRKQTGRISPWTTRGPLWKADHLQRMRDSGRFRFTRELVMHSVEEGDADRLIGGARSMGAIEVHKDELPVAELEATTRRVLGDRVVPFWFGYRVRLGIR